MILQHIEPVIINTDLQSINRFYRIKKHSIPLYFVAGILIGT